MIFLDRDSKVKVFIWPFMSRGSFSIILWISLGTTEEGSKDKDGSVIGYAHRSREIILVLRTFLKS